MKQRAILAVTAVAAAISLGACGVAGDTRNDSTTKVGTSSVQVALGNNFTGNFVSISGFRNTPADGKYPCKSEVNECIELNADGTTKSALNSLCPTENYPTEKGAGLWTFNYALHKGPGCNSLLANLKCEPHVGETLVKGHNSNDVECRTRNADKRFDFCVVDPYTGAGRENCPDALKTVLILGPTSCFGNPTMERKAAEELGFIVEVANPTQWAGKSEQDFAAYRAIILGDCGDNMTNIAPAEGNRTTWGPAITGNVIVIGADPAEHAAGGSNNAGAYKYIKDAIAFATYKPYQTGAYISLSGYYTYSAQTQVTVLEPFGQFLTEGVGGLSPCAGGSGANGSHIVGTGPVLDDLTDADLDLWNCSVHEVQNVTPGPPEFCNFAIFTNPASPLVSKPYIVARGLDNCLAP